MMVIGTVVLTTLWAMGPVCGAQEPEQPAPAPGASAQEAPGATAQEPQQVPNQQGPDQQGMNKWIRELGSESYRDRQQAENKLREAGEKALPELKKAAQEATDQEVQWRARRLVRQIEGGERGLQQREPQPGREGLREPGLRWHGGGQWGGGQPLPESMRRQFDELFRDMEMQFGLDIPRARFFQDDFFRDLQEQMKAGGQNKSLSMQIGPDGAVRAEVKETNADGQVETKVYEAPDMESFQAQHPGVLGENGLRMGLVWPREARGLLRAHPSPWLERIPGPAPRSGVDTAPRDGVDMGAEPAAELPPAGKRLGIVVRPQIAPELREYLDLEDGVGLQVEAVQPGSLAEALDLRPGDIVVDIGGRRIAGTNDVQEALGGINPGGAVEVRFLRKGVEKTATTVKPEVKAEAKPSEASPLQRRKADKGQDDGVR